MANVRCDNLNRRAAQQQRVFFQAFLQALQLHQKTINDCFNHAGKQARQWHCLKDIITSLYKGSIKQRCRVLTLHPVASMLVNCTWQ